VGITLDKVISELRLLAQLTRGPVSSDLRAAIRRSHSLDETTNTRFGQARSLADAVLFEFGPSRRRDVAMRHHLRRWQPQLRSLFMMLIESFNIVSECLATNCRRPGEPRSMPMMIDSPQCWEIRAVRH
jgi:hypothetical protein